MKSTPTTEPSRAARASACLSRSWKSTRFARPVIASWNAWCISSCWSLRGSVTSRRVITTPDTLRSARRSRQCSSSSSSVPRAFKARKSSCWETDSPPRTAPRTSISRFRSPGWITSGRRTSVGSAPKTPRADGLAYRIRSSSSRMVITSAVFWIRVRKYASLLRWLTSWLSAIRSSASATWPASTSTERCSSRNAQPGAPTCSTPTSESPCGRSCSTIGQRSVSANWVSRTATAQSTSRVCTSRAAVPVARSTADCAAASGDGGST